MPLAALPSRSSLFFGSSSRLSEACFPGFLFLLSTQILIAFDEPALTHTGIHVVLTLSPAARRLPAAVPLCAFPYGLCTTHTLAAVSQDTPTNRRYMSAVVRVDDKLTDPGRIFIDGRASVKRQTVLAQALCIAPQYNCLRHPR